MWNSIPNVNLVVLLFCVASTRLSIITQKSPSIPELQTTPSQLEGHLKRWFQRWDESQRMRGLQTCLLNPEHLFGLCFKRAAGDSGKTSPFSLGLTWIGAAYAGLIAHGTKTPDLWSRGWKYWQSGHLWSPSHRVSGLWLLGLCKAHSLVRNLETLHNSEIV